MEMSGASSSSAEQPSKELNIENSAEAQPTYKVFRPPNVASAAPARECVL